MVAERFPIRAEGAHGRAVLAGSPRGELVRLALLLALCVPHALVGLGVSLPAGAARWIASHENRVISGYVSLALFLGQFAISARNRSRRVPGATATWQKAHRLGFLWLLPAVVVHTGAGAGTQLTRALATVFVGILLVAQCGHTFKSLTRWAADQWPRARRLDALANRDDGLIHRTGIVLHVVLAWILLVLLGWHVFAVYFF